MIYCRNSETGALKYAERLAAECWATAIYVGERSYCFGRNSVTKVLSAGNEFEVLTAKPAVVRPGVGAAKKRHATIRFIATRRYLRRVAKRWKPRFDEAAVYGVAQSFAAPSAQERN